MIGGSGVYELSALEGVHEVEVDTPFGPPSDKLVVGNLGETKLVFLARHGAGHRIVPHEINYRANIYAMKSLGVEWLVSVSAVGSMREEIRPGDVVIVDQFIDRTSGRASSFFGDGAVAHVSMADPVSPVLAGLLGEVASECAAGRDDVKVHRGGTYVVINGPQFSTRAESKMYRQWGADVIGMTNMPEARLAREAEISYATVALSTDYDCWHESEDDVSVEAILAIMKKNAELARELIGHLPARLPEKHDCIAASALDGAIVTAAHLVPAETRTRLSAIAGKYL